MRFIHFSWASNREKMHAIIATGESPLAFLTQFGVEWQLLISQAISFALVTAVLYYFAFKPVIAKAQERRQIIEKGLSDAENARKQLESSEAEASKKLAQAALESSEILRRANDDAKRTIERAAEEAAAKAADIQARAEAQIEAEKLKMREDLKAELSGLVVKAAESVVGEILTQEQRGKLAELAAKKLGDAR